MDPAIADLIEKLREVERKRIEVEIELAWAQHQSPAQHRAAGADAPSRAAADTLRPRVGKGVG
jgi:hypothetical protein